MSTRSANGRKRDSAAATGATDLQHPSSSIVTFAAARAHDAVDLLHEQAKARIDRAQQALLGLHVDQMWSHARPALGRTTTFVREYPLRTVSILALLTGAFLLTRAPRPAVVRHRSA